MPFEKSKDTIIKLIVNSIVFLSVAVIAAIGILFGAGDGQVGDYIIGIGYFKPYTMDSNILAGISSLIIVYYSIKSLIAERDVTPKWAVTLQFMAAVCLSLTFIIAALFLAPMKVMGGQSYFTMFKNDMFFFHFVNPILSVFSFVCLQKNYMFEKKGCIWGVVPTIIYSFVYLFMVVSVKKWDDFYNFTFGGRYYLIPAVFIVIYSLVLFFSWLLTRLHNSNYQKKIRA